MRLRAFAAVINRTGYKSEFLFFSFFFFVSCIPALELKHWSKFIFVRLSGYRTGFIGFWTPQSFFLC